jgi:hypothetical protein
VTARELVSSRNMLNSIAPEMTNPNSVPLQSNAFQSHRIIAGGIIEGPNLDFIRKHNKPAVCMFKCFDFHYMGKSLAPQAVVPQVFLNWYIPMSAFHLVVIHA